MTMFTRYGALLVVALASIGAVVRAEEPRTPERNVQFEVAGEMQWPWWGRLARPVVPAYVAVVALRHDPYPSEWKLDWRTLEGAEAIGEEMHQTRAGRSLSKEQRPLTWLAALDWYSIGYTASRPGTIRLAAASEADARKMVEVFFEWYDAKAREAVERAKKEVAEAPEQEARTRKEVQELKSKIEAEKTERQALEQVIAYTGAEDATKDILELDKALRSVQIDLSAAEAKANVIKQFQREIAGEIQNAFREMLITQDIERAGALARKSALEAERKKAVHYRDLVRQIDADSSKLKTLLMKLTNIPLKAQKLELALGEPPGYMKPAELADNKVQIYRVTPPLASGTEGGGNPSATQSRPANAK